jgi:hypothetical protein
MAGLAHNSLTGDVEAKLVMLACGGVVEQKADRTVSRWCHCLLPAARAIGYDVWKNKRSA